MGESLMTRVLHAFGIVLAVCIGVRFAAWLIEPVLPLLGTLVVFLFISYLLLSGPRHRA